VSYPLRRSTVPKGHPPLAKRIAQPAPVLELPAEMLTIEQAADRIGMSARYVRRAIAERRIAFHYFGRSVP
jgi:excisionase family DNA binding protein